MDWTEKVFFGLLLAALGGFIAFVGAAVTLSAISDGKVDYCFTKSYTQTGWNVAAGSQQINLIGHRPWSEDVHLASFNNPNDAASYAERIHCSLAK